MIFKKKKDKMNKENIIPEENENPGNVNEQEEMLNVLNESEDPPPYGNRPPTPNPLEVIKEELAVANDKYLRLYSDFENYKKRIVRDRIELLKTANADVIISMLPVLDDFERALRSMENASDVEAVKEGVVLIQNKLKSILAQKGVSPIESAGKTFDTDLHEAVTSIPVEEEDKKGTVIDEVEKGYMLHDKVIRHAKVVVGS